MHEHDCTVLQVGQLGHGLRHEKVFFFFFFFFFFLNTASNEPRHEKTGLCLCELSYCTADQRLCFVTRIVQFLFFLNLKFQASSHLL